MNKKANKMSEKETIQKIQNLLENLNLKEGEYLEYSNFLMKIYKKADTNISAPISQTSPVGSFVTIGQQPMTSVPSFIKYNW